MTKLQRNALPLAALDAVAIDTETTGLDPREARIVEVGAVRISRGKPVLGRELRRLVRPGRPIPAAAVQIHGIDDRAVADAPLFADVWPEIAAYLGASVLIGHTIGFDLAIIGNEIRRIGANFPVSSVLDVRTLAEIAEPGLAGYTLENLASWLGTTLSGRHSALGDARAAAEIFCALVPRLRERSIRTLGEASRACETLSANQAASNPSVWNTPIKVSEPAVAMSDHPSRIDVYPYRVRVSSLMTTPARGIVGTAALGAALERLEGDKISSLFVSQAEQREPLRADECGIVTERDILRALSAHGATALALPVGQIATKPLHTIAASDFAYQAIARMNRLRIRHLGATDEAGTLVGAVSARDLLRLRAEGGAALVDEIEQADDVAALTQAWSKLPSASAALLAEGLSARDVAAVISNEIGALTRRAAVLAEFELKRDGKGRAPARYAFAVLGSAGRYESLLAMDQDNALVFEDGAPADADCWFAALGERVAAILDEAGVPYCLGGVMAKNPNWRGSRTAWRSRVETWLDRSDPGDLLSVDIFFDIRAIHGDIGLANELRRSAFDLARGRPEFCKLLVEAGGQLSPSRAWWGGFQTQKGRIDLKKAGLFGVVSAARALAIRYHITAPTTPERLSALKALGVGAENDLDSLIDAHGTFLDLVLRQQLEDIQHGLRPGNRVEVGLLSRRHRKALRVALAAAEQAEAVTHDLLF